MYDAKTGEIRDDRKHQSLLEDFWLPRREGGRGTEITTLPWVRTWDRSKTLSIFKRECIVH